MTFWKWVKTIFETGSALVFYLALFLLDYIIKLNWTKISERLKPLDDTDQFKVYIYKDELEKIHEWVLRKDNIETGGDLFGLWIDKRNVVVQFVLGPGKDCQRTTTSFHQDIDYLAKVGESITRKYGLCNIGQWHSHHRLSLCKPSVGDENTVWTNMPVLDLERFVMLIATIESTASRVDVHCFLFESDKKNILAGEICVMEQEDSSGSPVRMYRDLNEMVKAGMEVDQSEHNWEDDNSVVIDMGT